MNRFGEFVKTLNKPLFVLIIGLSGSGKTTLANKISEEYSMEIISFNEIKKELERNEMFNIEYNEILKFAGQKIRKKLEKGESVILDHAELNSQRRAYLLKQLKDVNCATACVLKLVDIKTCIKRQKDKLLEISEDRIWKQYEQFQIPNPAEGWNYIARDVFNDGPLLSELYKQRKAEDCVKITQHLEIATQITIDKGCPLYLVNAAKYHDIGKFSLKFIKENEDSEFIHHENIGAYLYALAANDVNWLYVSNLILWHRIAYKMTTEKKRKIQKRLGKRFTSDLILLAAIDKDSKNEVG